MKHGQKAKGKAAKAKASKKSSTAKTKSKASQSARRPKEAGGTSKSRGRGAFESLTFNNPTVAGAFKRAVRKYPNAFRRLTD